MNLLKSAGLFILLAIGLSSCIVAHPGYGLHRGGPGWHRGGPGYQRGPGFHGPRHHGGHRHYDRGYSRGGGRYRR